MFVMGNVFGEMEFIKELENWGYFCGDTLLNKKSWIIWVVLKRTDT